MELHDWIGLGGIPVIVALVQLVKPFVTDERLWPAVAVAFGIAWNVAVTAATAPLDGTGALRALLVGVVLGLAASGLYSGARTAAGR